MVGATSFTLYNFCIFTVCILIFDKGSWVPGITETFLPILWLIGANLLALKSSRENFSSAFQFASPATTGGSPDRGNFVVALLANKGNPALTFW